MDILDLKWKLTGQNVLCPQVEISARFVESTNQNVEICDLSKVSGKHILFPNIVTSLTSEEKRELMEDIVTSLLKLYRSRTGK